MTAQTTNDLGYISFIRNHATNVLEEASAGVEANTDWNSCYGGATRLPPEIFTDANGGLVKVDIEHAKDVLAALNAWLDVEGENRRTYLMAVCFQEAQ